MHSAILIYNNLCISNSEASALSSYVDESSEILIPWQNSGLEKLDDDPDDHNIFSQSYLSACFHFDDMVKNILKQHALHKLFFCASEKLH